jgi:hypothetical protein
MIITEVKKLKYDTDCRKYPVYFSWLNTLTGWEHWLFDTTQFEGLTTTLNGTFESYITDLATTNERVSTLQMGANPSITVFGLIPKEDMKGVKTILYSLSVRMLLNPETWESEGVKWLSVRPQVGSFRVKDERETHQLVEITFNLDGLSTQKR